MSEPSELTAGWLYDGVVALRRDVEVRAVGNAIEIVGIEQLDPAQLEAVEGSAARAFRYKERKGWRLSLDGPPDPALLALLPTVVRYGKVIDRVGIAPAVGLFAAVSAVLVLVLLQVPAWVAPFIPPAFEERMGQALVGDLGGRFCKGPGGQAALDRMVARLDGGQGITARVVDIPLVNAVALPGGNIVLFNGLLKQAKSPDEVAGVVAHEIGHVREHHVTRALLRQAGLSVLLGGLNPEIGAGLNTILSTRYSRAAETEADGFAIDAMTRAAVTPRDTAAFFGRIGQEEASLGKAAIALSYVASHPVSSVRQRRFASSARPQTAYRPTLDRNDWDALADICSNDPDRDTRETWSDLF